MSLVVLLGPQRLRPTLASVVEELGLDGRIAAVTAGWQEREREDDELAEHLGGWTVNLGLYRRAEQVFQQDPELFQAHRERQNRLRRMQRLYRVRLDYALGAVRDLMAREDGALLEEERTAALEALRRLDGEHLERIGEVHREFLERWRPRSRPAVARQRDGLGEILESCAALAIAGGHVAVLLNRIRLFDLLELAPGLPILAWSAGAMTLADRVVLFHDSPPQGAGNAEVLEQGLGLARDFIPLPHARRRLRLDDPVRVATFARRFAPRISLTLDEGARLHLVDGRWRAQQQVRRLTATGAVVPMAGPEETG